MYRTYTKFFKVEFEITTLGTGSHVIRLPRSLWITMDFGISILVLLPIIRFVILPLLNLFFGLREQIEPTLWGPFSWIISIVISVGLAVILRRFEPNGKKIVPWTVDFLKYFLRSKWSDGWSSYSVNRSKIKYKSEVYTKLCEGITCKSLPAEGKDVTQFILHKPATVILKKGRIKVVEGKKHKPGLYSLESSSLVFKREL